MLIYKIEKLKNTNVATRYEKSVMSNSTIQVPKNHIAILINNQNQEKQRMYEGVHTIKFVQQKKSFLGLSKKHALDITFFIINTSFTFQNLWGGKFLFEDKPTSVEISFGVNGTIDYKLTDYENLFDLMEREDISIVDQNNIDDIYEKQRRPMNNVIINFLSNWCNHVDSIKDLNNRKVELEDYIIKEINKSEYSKLIEVVSLAISEFYSKEAEDNRQLKNESNSKAFVNKTEGLKETKSSIEDDILN